MTTECCSKGIKRALLYIVLVSAMGGFLFGFDSGVISGCEEAIQREFQLSGFWHGFTVSGALIGNTAEVVLDSLESDVLVVKPDDILDRLEEVLGKR